MGESGRVWCKSRVSSPVLVHCASHINDMIVCKLSRAHCTLLGAADERSRLQSRQTSTSSSEMLTSYLDIELCDLDIINYLEIGCLGLMILRSYWDRKNSRQRPTDACAKNKQASLLTIGMGPFLALGHWLYNSTQYTSYKRTRERHEKNRARERCAYNS